MTALEQQLFALELILTSWLAMEPNHVRRELAAAVGQLSADSDPVEEAIRRRAVDLVLSCEGPSEV